MPNRSIETGSLDIHQKNILNAIPLEGSVPIHEALGKAEATHPEALIASLTLIASRHIQTVGNGRLERRPKEKPPETSS